MKQLEQIDVLTDCQHGFRAKRCTASQFIFTLRDFADVIQRGESTHAATLRFSKGLNYSVMAAVENYWHGLDLSLPNDTNCL